MNPTSQNEQLIKRGPIIEAVQSRMLSIIGDHGPRVISCCADSSLAHEKQTVMGSSAWGREFVGSKVHTVVYAGLRKARKVHGLNGQLGYHAGCYPGICPYGRCLINQLINQSVVEHCGLWVLSGSPDGTSSSIGLPDWNLASPTRGRRRRCHRQGICSSRPCRGDIDNIRDGITSFFFFFSPHKVPHR